MVRGGAQKQVKNKCTSNMHKEYNAQTSVQCAVTITMSYAGMDVVSAHTVAAGDTFGRLHLLDTRAPSSHPAVQIQKRGTKIAHVHANPADPNLLLTCGGDHLVRLLDLRQLPAEQPSPAKGPLKPSAAELAAFNHKRAVNAVRKVVYSMPANMNTHFCDRSTTATTVMHKTVLYMLLPSTHHRPTLAPSLEPESSPPARTTACACGTTRTALATHQTGKSCTATISTAT